VEWAPYSSALKRQSNDFHTMTIEATIRHFEGLLRAAQLQSDVTALDELIDDALLFTGPDGALMTKSDDLALHRGGVVQFTALEPRDMRLLVLTDDVVVVALRTHLKGSFQNTAFAGDFRATRVWARRGEAWRIVAGHVTAMPAKD
jgi:ketosteroid isomerase-like protein